MSGLENRWKTYNSLFVFHFRFSMCSWITHMSHTWLVHSGQVNYSTDFPLTKYSKKCLDLITLCGQKQQISQCWCMTCNLSMSPYTWKVTGQQGSWRSSLVKTGHSTIGLHHNDSMTCIKYICKLLSFDFNICWKLHVQQGESILVNSNVNKLNMKCEMKECDICFVLK